MKKSKILLSFIGILSALGGTFAFKAQQRFTGALFCYTNSPILFFHQPISTISARYTTTNVGTSLICTIPGPNAYVVQAVKMNA